MDNQKKISLLEELFEADPGTISEGMELSSVHWDSMSMLGLIAMFKVEFGTKLEPTKLRTFRTIQDIMNEMK